MSSCPAIRAIAPRRVLASARASNANRVARSFSSSGYFLGAGMNPILPGHQPPRNPGWIADRTRYPVRKLERFRRVWSARLNSDARSRPGYPPSATPEAAPPVGLGASALHARSTRGSSDSGDGWDVHGGHQNPLADQGLGAWSLNHRWAGSVDRPTRTTALGPPG